MTYVPPDPFVDVLSSLGLLWAWRLPSSGDVTLAADGTFTPANGVTRLGTLTLAGFTYRSTKCRGLLVCDALAAGGGVISFEASGAPALGADPAEDYPRGGRALNGSGEAIGGYGGGFGLVIARSITGAAMTVRARGTAGNRNTTAAGALVAAPGEGALSALYALAGYGPTVSGTNSRWAGGIAADMAPVLPGAMALAAGGMHTTGLTGGNVSGGAGGGNGVAASTSLVGGGSGVGGGGGANAGGSPAAVGAGLVPLDWATVVELWRAGCRGGGGGAAHVNTVGASNAGAGGGAGFAGVICDAEANPTVLVVTGGATAGTNGAAGGAGASIKAVA